MFEIEILFAFALFSVGLYGLTAKSDFLRIFFSLEMLLNSVILLLAVSAKHLNLEQNISVAYLVIVIATLEAGAGVLIFMVANKITNKSVIDDLNQEKNSNV
jgi:NADH:ubiquinone oxidoreductase subunit K